MAEPRKRVIVFIDGNNLYHRLKENDWKTWIDMGSLSKRVAGDRELVKIHYYNSPPPGGKGHTLKSNEFLAEVSRVPNLELHLARLQAVTKSDENGPYHSFVEKGADTALTTDVVNLAAQDEYDTAIIISNDSDYEPAARLVKETYSKEVEVVYFAGSRPFAMEKVATMRVFRQSLLKEHDYDPKEMRRTRQQGKKRGERG